MSDTIRTDNSQTLANAEKRIEELEAIKDDWKRLAQAADTRIEELEKQFTAQEIDHQGEIAKLESQRDRLLERLKYEHAPDAVCCWYRDAGYPCPTCALIREIEGGR